MARFIASLTGAHLITDIPSRWKEIELDREEAGVSAVEWEPFGKAFQESDLKFLNDVPLTAALRLRKENRLESMRVFLRKVWRACASDVSFSASNARALAEELQHEITLADEEWRKIDRDLAKWFGGTVAAAVGAAATIGTGNPGWVAAATAAVGVVELGVAWDRRREFGNRFPAGFFLDLRKKQDA